MAGNILRPEPERPPSHALRPSWTTGPGRQLELETQHSSSAKPHHCSGGGAAFPRCLRPGTCPDTRLPAALSPGSSQAPFFPSGLSVRAPPKISLTTIPHPHSHPHPISKIAK